ncbi:NAD(P)H-dependent flavin oxidoreductase [Secundilactobacillus odoratitofui]|uniref:NAD(P)H-dependent flavin oxidoreductase n=1 Tax=Secundilactobacillus odoratitofui TaxID=480930 RepID=UPI000704C893|nr:nitronate monooxygenase [Secundilactobacillus odoratitofui]
MRSVTEILGTKYPLIQAPMSWVTDARLVAAVSNAGGLGVLGPNAGQIEVTDDPIDTAERMRQELRKARQLTDKPIGLNILTPKSGQNVAESVFTAALLKMAYEEKVLHFAVVGSAHEELFQDIKAHNGTLIFRPLTPTVAQMQMGERFGADILVATGSDEGGVMPRQDFGTFTVVPAMVDAVSIPVFAAGGINDVRGVRAAYALGAQGVYIGSRFLLTEESPMADIAKQAVLDAQFGDILRVSPTQRSVKTPAAVKYARRYCDNQDPMLDREISINGGLRPGMLLGDFERGIISVNNGVDMLNTVPSVKQLVDDLMA